MKESPGLTELHPTTKSSCVRLATIKDKVCWLLFSSVLTMPSIHTCQGSSPSTAEALYDQTVPIISVLRRLKQKGQELRATLSYRAASLLQKGGGII